MEGPFLLAFAASKAVWRGTPQAGKSSFRPPFSVCSFAHLSLGRLDRRMAQQQLDLLKLPADGAA
jgi:hypothetical protein